MIELLNGLRGHRKVLVMLVIVVALSGLLVFRFLTGAEFIDALKFISTAFMAANLGGKLVSKGTPQ